MPFLPVAAAPAEVLASTTPITQTAHGFTTGQVVTFATGVWTLAIADTEPHARVTGIVSAVVDANTFRVATAGRVSGLSGLTTGTRYYLSPTVSGGLTPETPTTISRLILTADSATSGYMVEQRDQLTNTGLHYATFYGDSGTGLGPNGGSLVVVSTNSTTPSVVPPTTAQLPLATIGALTVTAAVSGPTVSGNQVVIAAAGLYAISGFSQQRGNTSALNNNMEAAQLIVNGAVVATFAARDSDGAVAGRTLPIDWSGNLNVGDVVDIRVRRATATDVDINRYSIIIQQRPTSVAVPAGSVATQPLGFYRAQGTNATINSSYQAITTVSSGAMTTVQPVAQRITLPTGTSGNGITTTSSVVTVANAGTYNVTANVGFDTPAGTISYVQLVKTTGGTPTVVAVRETNPGNAANLRMNTTITWTDVLAAGDTLEFRLGANAAVAITLAGIELNVQQVPTATVADPGSIVPVNLHAGRIYHDTSFTYTPTAGTTITFAAAGTGPNNVGMTVSPTAGTITATQAGTYAIYGATGIRASGGINQLGVYVNGVAALSGAPVQVASAGQSDSASVSGQLALAVGDVVTLRPLAVNAASGWVGSSLYVQQTAAQSVVSPNLLTPQILSRVAASNATAFSIPTSVTTPITTGWGTSGVGNFNIGSNFNPATGIYTCPRAGQYRVSLVARSSTGTHVANSEWVPIIRKNGADALGVTTITEGAISSFSAGEVTATLDCAAGDTLQPAVFQSSGATLTLLAAVNTNVFTVEEQPSSSVPYVYPDSLPATTLARLVTPLAADFTLSADTVWTASGMTVTVPTAGTWRIGYSATGSIANNSTTVRVFQARLFDVTNNAVVAGTTRTIVAFGQSGFTPANAGTAETETFTTTTAANTYRLELFESGGNTALHGTLTAGSTLFYAQEPLTNVVLANTLTPTTLAIARATNTAGSSLPTVATPTVLTAGWTNAFDNLSALSSGTFTAPHAGNYNVLCRLAFTGTTVANMYRAVIFKNGSFYGYGYSVAVSGQTQVGAQVNETIQLVAGDTIQVGYYNDTAATLAVGAGYNAFSVEEVPSSTVPYIVPANLQATSLAYFSTGYIAPTWAATFGLTSSGVTTTNPTVAALTAVVPFNSANFTVGTNTGGFTTSATGITVPATGTYSITYKADINTAASGAGAQLVLGGTVVDFGKFNENTNAADTDGQLTLRYFGPVTAGQLVQVSHIREGAIGADTLATSRMVIEQVPVTTVVNPGTVPVTTLDWYATQAYSTNTGTNLSTVAVAASTAWQTAQPVGQRITIPAGGGTSGITLASNVFTVTQAGLYEIEATFVCEPGNLSVAFVQAIKNNATFLAAGSWTSSSGDSSTITIAWSGNLAAGDTIDFRAGNAAAVTVVVHGLSVNIQQLPTTTVVNPASAPLSTNITADTGSNSKAVTPAAVQAFTAGGVFLGIRTFTTIGAVSYTPTAGTTAIQAYLIGGGGAGGGAPANGNTVGGSGGGAGAVQLLSTAVSAATTYTGSVGAAGAAASGAAGGNGGNTTLTIGATYTAGGGSGGAVAGATTGADVVAGGAGGTGTTGAATVWSINGQAGGYYFDAGVPNNSLSGGGGSNQFGNGGPQTASQAAGSAVGVAGSGFGAGGGGAWQNNSTARAGGAGTAGAIIIYEYK